MEITVRRMRRDRAHHVVLGVGRKPRQVFERAHVTGLEAGGTPQALIEGDLPAARHQALELLLLGRAELVAGKRAEALEKWRADGELAESGMRIEFVEVRFHARIAESVRGDGSVGRAASGSRTRDRILQIARIGRTRQREHRIDHGVRPRGLDTRPRHQA